jgi:hypothetical protein
MPSCPPSARAGHCAGLLGKVGISQTLRYAKIPRYSSPCPALGALSYRGPRGPPRLCRSALPGNLRAATCSDTATRSGKRYILNERADRLDLRLQQHAVRHAVHDVRRLQARGGRPRARRLRVHLHPPPPPGRRPRDSIRREIHRSACCGRSPACQPSTCRSCRAPMAYRSGFNWSAPATATRGSCARRAGSWPGSRRTESPRVRGARPSGVTPSNQ